MKELAWCVLFILSGLMAVISFQLGHRLHSVGFGATMGYLSLNMY